MTCDCEKYERLEACRHCIYERIQKSKTLIRTFDVIAEKKDENNSLLKCAVCNQLWQESASQNWGSTKYLFKVPEISVENWLEESFIEPEKILNYLSSRREYERKQVFIERSEKCRKESCDENATQYTVFCKEHQIGSLQNIGVLAKFPKGRIFETVYEK
jgi:hypothetical protein